MAISNEDIAFALELFEGVGPLTTRKMFGGLSIYADGVIFAIVMNDGIIYLKGAGDMIARYEDEGMARWTYENPNAKRKPTPMPYWALTDEMLDDPEAASALARDALKELS